MRVSVEEVSPGLGRWVANVWDRHGQSVAMAFSDVSADDAEDQLLRGIGGSNAAPIEGKRGQLMLMAAFRYCLGRRTYIVDDCIKWLTRWWGHITDHDRVLIVKDIVSTLMDDEAGDGCDAVQWRMFAMWALARMSFEEQDDIRRALAWKHAEWPLPEDVGDDL